MKLFFTDQYSMHPERMLERAGYGRAQTRVPSFQRRLSGAAFPRFHAYIDRTKDGFRINVHLDQKAACYNGNTAHSGEYDSSLVKQEAERIKMYIEQFRC